MTKLRDWTLKILVSWYFWGLLGWMLVIANYPLDVIIPRYAG